MSPCFWKSSQTESKICKHHRLKVKHQTSQTESKTLKPHKLKVKYAKSQTERKTSQQTVLLLIPHSNKPSYLHYSYILYMYHNPEPFNDVFVGESSNTKTLVIGSVKSLTWHLITYVTKISQHFTEKSINANVITI